MGAQPASLPPSPRGLADLIDQLQAGGRYTFESAEARAALGVSDVALRHSLRRLAAKGRVVSPRRGFHVIVPVEYRSTGAPPPTWFIDEMMARAGCPYYVGLLSAAAMYGAAHHQPQEFQVVAGQQLRPATAGRMRIRFFAKRAAAVTPTRTMNTPAGIVRVSTPEATALDLARYVAGAGYLSNVATLLAELAEQVEPDKLVDAARAEGELAAAQRVGYLFDLVDAGEKVGPLAAWVASRDPRLVSLRPDLPAAGVPKDSRWRILVNEEVEADL